MKISDTKLRELIQEQLSRKELINLYEKSLTGKANVEGEVSEDLSPDVQKFFTKLKSKSELVLAASRLNTKIEKIQAVSIFALRLGIEDASMLTTVLPLVKKQLEELSAGGGPGESADKPPTGAPEK